MSKSELEEIKKSIEAFINDGQLDNAKMLIKQYCEMFGFDDDIASMEAIIYLYEGDKVQAINIIRKGLRINIKNCDLYYTLGNIYESNKEYNQAYLCYEQALYFCIDNRKDIFLSSMEELKKNQNIDVKNTSFIILTYNQLKYTKMCIDSIRNNNAENTYEIIVVDNNSTDGTVEWLKSQKDINVIYNKKNEGFPKGCNQGISIANKENNIMLLNNDTILMVNSIFNLRMGLYSDEKVGATGSVSNSVAYYQQLVLDCKEFTDNVKFALLNNIPDDNYYEERVKLIGFAMLIKREAINKVGGLEEKFTPGNYEDDDISLRILKNGYKLLLCRDSYIHHFGSTSFKENAYKYNELLNTNRIKFYEKWGFDANEAFKIFLQLPDFLEEKDKKVLEVNSLSGATLLNARNNKKDVELYGITSDKFDYIYDVYNIKRIDNIINKKFDVIFLHDYKLALDKQYITKLINALSNEGKLILYISNQDTYEVEYVDYMMKKINNYMMYYGLKQYKLHKNTNGSTVVSLYIEYKVCDDSIIEDDAIHFLEKSEVFDAEDLLKVLKNHKSSRYKEIEKLIKMYHQLKFELRKVDFDYEIEEDELLKLIEEYPFEDESICILIIKDIINKEKVLNQIAISHFNNGKYEKVLPYLNTAYEINENNQDTLYNLAYVLNYYGEKDLALKYASRIDEKSDEFVQLINEIEGGTNE